ncbi:hypothetical protein I6E74_06280 [Salinibacterium sp. SWN139]|uniref:hypothetical protein n=1 Tax=Salinibacterium sp. SWN139 TaxID=2792055 RepID=UPI0018CD503E|nr:hypothetical protein [Salinibacterium sp. SWN139]MBH0053778.1 hypothetical protein [Salinibacterium sp. SWN139]
MTEESAKPNSERGMFRDIVVAIIAFVAGTAIIGFINWLSKSDLPFWVYLLGGFLVVILPTIFLPRWRKAIWVNIGKWRPLTTEGKLHAAHAAGLSQAEQAYERARSRPSIRAQWKILLDPVGRRNEWTITNVALGSVAKNVAVHVSPSDLRVDSALDWPEIVAGEFETFVATPASDDFDGDFTFGISWENEHGVALEVHRVTWAYDGVF